MAQKQGRKTYKSFFFCELANFKHMLHRLKPSCACLACNGILTNLPIACAFAFRVVAPEFRKITLCCIKSNLVMGSITKHYLFQPWLNFFDNAKANQVYATR